MGERGDPPADGDRFAAARDRMVREQLRPRGITDAATLAAMSLVPREAFVPGSRLGDAYADGALAIGGGQTISQPYIVARMTELLALGEHGWPWDDRTPTLLDVGTGSGYQAAVLAHLGAEVITVERDPALAEAARQRLARLGYRVEVVVGDGTLGWARRAPYVGIVVAAAAPAVPPPLVAQLAEGGRLVLPVGTRSAQRLTVLRCSGGRITTKRTDACVFVPLIGRHGFAS